MLFNLNWECCLIKHLNNYCKSMPCHFLIEKLAPIWDTQHMYGSCIWPHFWEEQSITIIITAPPPPPPQQTWARIVPGPRLPLAINSISGLSWSPVHSATSALYKVVVRVSRWYMRNSLNTQVFIKFIIINNKFKIQKSSIISHEKEMKYFWQSWPFHTALTNGNKSRVMLILYLFPYYSVS